MAELDPVPDQVTVTVNTTQMNVTEHAGIDDFEGVSRGFPHLDKTYKDMIVPSSPSFVEEHIRRLTAAGIQSEFQVYNIDSFETIERLMRRGVYKGPLVMNWAVISRGMDQANIDNLANMLRAVPDGAVVTVESSVLNVLPINMIGMALGLHVRCGIEDVLWNQTRTGKASTVPQAHRPTWRQA